VGISVPHTGNRPRATSHTSVVAMPIKSCRGHVLGVVEARGHRAPVGSAPSSFTSEDEQLLKWVALQLAFVIERRDMEREWSDLQKKVGRVGWFLERVWRAIQATTVRSWCWMGMLCARDSCVVA